MVISKMKKKYLILSIITLALLGASGALACGWGWFGGFGNIDPEKVAEKQQVMFQNQSQILGIDIEEVKEAWAEGKTMKEIMEERNIGQEEVQARIKEMRLQEMRNYLQVLVDKGVITQNQADKRLEVMQNQFENGRGGKMGRGFRGLGFGFRRRSW